MKRTYICLLTLFFALISAHAGEGSDKRSESILSRTTSTFRQAGGIRIQFDGSRQGTLLLKGECFYLECEGIQCWYDGKTQWSYVAENEEVTVSTPSPEELQGINPYVLVHTYDKLFDSQYNGRQNYQGKQVEKITLTPHQESDIRSVRLLISTAYQPLSISVKLANGQTEEFRIVSYKPNQPYTDNTFRFDTKQYPHAEIIDMR